MQLTKNEQIGAFKQLVQVVDESPKLQTYLYMWLWNMLENLDSIYEIQERWEDV